MIDITIIRKAPFLGNPRLDKEVVSLASNYSVLVLAWDRKAKSYPFRNMVSPKIQHKVFVKHFNLKTSYGNVLFLFKFPIFWCWVLIQLLLSTPKIIHSCDLDAIIPAYIYKFIRPKTKIVFDVWDNYSLDIWLQSHHRLCSFVAFFEDFFALKSDSFILPTETRLKIFNRARSRPVTIIMNYPCDVHFNSTQRSNKFRIVYAGKVENPVGLLKIANAIKDFSDIEFIVIGRVIDPNLFKMLLKFPQIKYVGEVSYIKALEFESSADLIPVMYNPEIPINRLANPNKFFEAMMLGVPVITNVMRNIIEKKKCGIMVDYNNLNSIKTAIQYLKENPFESKAMGQRGRIAFEQEYNWSIMEKRLLTLYKNLIC